MIRPMEQCNSQNLSSTHLVAQIQFHPTFLAPIARSSVLFTGHHILLPFPLLKDISNLGNILSQYNKNTYDWASLFAYIGTYVELCQHHTFSSFISISL